MTRVLIGLVGVVICVLGMSMDVAAQERQMAHMVFFKAAEQPTDAADKLAAACEKHLSGHEGTVYFSVGIRDKEMERDVNDTDFDVALHLVFENKAAYEKYAEHPRHLKFIEENKSLWAGVRVLDSLITSKPAAPQPMKKPRVQPLKKSATPVKEVN